MTRAETTTVNGADVPILQIRNVSKRFSKRLDLAARIAARLGAKVRDETVHAVDCVNLDVHHGEVVGLVGESGCGKSTLGRVVTGLLEPSEGDVLYRGVKRSTLDVRGRLELQMIFQNPYASLNPRMRVGDIVAEGLIIGKLVPRNEIKDRVREVMLRVGLAPEFVNRFPHQFSGGQRQRIGIARALAVNPRVLVCDESIAALDVSIQAQILNLFNGLQRDLDLTYLFISHDLGVVEFISHRVAIMYLGRIVEIAPTEELFRAPNHPYTRALLAEIPRLDLRKTTYQPIQGEIPSPLDPPPGCHFHPRCPRAVARCRTEAPRLKNIAPGRMAACHLNDET